MNQAIFASSAHHSPAQASRCVGVDAPKLMFSAAGACTLGGGGRGRRGFFFIARCLKVGVAALKVSFSF